MAKSSPVRVDQGAVSLRQERINCVTAGIESERMRAGFSTNCFDPAHSVRLEDFDQAGFADGDVEMSPLPIEEDHIRNAGKVCLRPHRSRPRIKGDKRLAVARAEQPPR